MKLTIDGQAYSFAPDDNSTVREILANLPLDLSLVRYAGHEYYAELPFTPEFDETRTSHILAGHLYYWDGWNAFVINFEDWDITPYQVVHLGEILSDTVASYLETAPETIQVTLIKDHQEE